MHPHGHERTSMHPSAHEKPYAIAQKQKVLDMCLTQTTMIQMNEGVKEFLFFFGGGEGCMHA
jgi:hypothetical protein